MPRRPGATIYTALHKYPDMKYFIETYGCQMNVHDSERMAGLLEASGYEPARDDLDADLVVINTCSVREKAEEKLYTRLGHLKGLERATGPRAAGRRGRLRRAAGRSPAAEPFRPRLTSSSARSA